MKRQASVETMRRLCEAMQKRWPESVAYIGQMFGTDFADAVAAYRAETAPLRSRAEWLVEVEQTLRVLSPEMLRRAGYEDLARLATEETAPEAEPFPGTSTGACHWCKTVAPVTPHGWDNICADCLKRTCEWCDDTSKPRLFLHRVPGSTFWVCRKCLEERKLPVPQTQNHTDVIHPDDRPCGCDQSEGLIQKLKADRLQYQDCLAEKIKRGQKLGQIKALAQDGLGARAHPLPHVASLAMENAIRAILELLE